MLQREESRHDFAFMAGVIVGAIAGALATLAFTPMSGAETRERLRDSASGLGPVKDRVGGVAETAGTLVASGKERVSGVTSATGSFVASGRERAAGLAAKSPLHIGHSSAGEDQVVSESSHADTTKIESVSDTPASTTEKPDESADAPRLVSDTDQ